MSALSSTISTRGRAAAGSGAVSFSSSRGGTASLSSARVIGTLNRKQLPRPTALSTESSPPMASTRRRLMARPSPAPPLRRLASVCRKPQKRWSSSSCGIPGPLSSTSTRRRTSREPLSIDSGPDSAPTRMMTLPAPVNFTALPSRLMNIWRSLDASALTKEGTLSWQSRAKPSPLASAEKRNMRSKSSSISRRQKAVGFSSTLPASIRDRSRISLIRASKCSPLR
ncbi:MAG: hypothetical protein BWX80_02961 [Candidatus Hydrogenedentes bacterium ADurb.Bin101]|nr:MAG: hypothetical protein BWX80_02961 [Candidatus Hydrogenedentes bacterium ADurb.Bin101]